MTAFRPPRDIRAASSLATFLAREGLASYEALAARAEAEPEPFWAAMLALAGTRWQTPPERLRDISGGAEHVRWGVGGRLNLTETLLDARLDAGQGQRRAIDWLGEDGTRRGWTLADLAAEAARVAGALQAAGVRPGDAVGIYMPMIPEIAAAFLGVARLGAVAVPMFSGFAAPALAARLADARARAVLTADATLRGGRVVPLESVLGEALAGAPTVATVISLRRFGMGGPGARDWAATLGAAPAAFAAVPVAADAALMIGYTSGTTGRPKGVIQTHLGVQGKAAADFLLCLDLKPGDRHLWMTDMGWVMGPLTLIATLLAGATLVMAEGAPATPDDPFRLLSVAARMEVSHLGVAPTLVRQYMAQDTAPLAALDLSRLRIVASTGEPWTEDAWAWQLEHICRHRAVPLNISGGTELFGGILTSTVLHDIRPCGFSAACLGTGARVFRPDGSEAGPGEVGELVVTEPPLGLTPGVWGDPERYHATYWSMFPGVWRHGDWVRRDADGTWFILGRSDDTLNIAGKRIGPPEIEAALTAGGEVIDAAAIGAPDAVKGMAVVCVCVPAPGVVPDAALVARLSAAVARELGKPFRPREIHFAAALPKTRSMKTMRRLVRAALLGEDPGDLSPLANPEALEALAALRPADV